MTEVAVDGSAALPTHDLLLAMAGRVDDDLLTWTRELAAVGEDFRAVELLTATLIADQVTLPARVRAALVETGRTVRTEFDADLALPAAREDEREGAAGTPHRFEPAPSGTGTGRITAALHGLLTRQVTGSRAWLTWRVTPAGSAPGPLPHAVVLVELAAHAANADVLAYQLASALDHAGAPASVEVFTAGAQLPDYHQAALLTARPFGSTSTVCDTDPARLNPTTETSAHAAVDPPAPVVAPKHRPAERSSAPRPPQPVTPPRPTLAPLAPVAAPTPVTGPTPVAAPDAAPIPDSTPIPVPTAAHAQVPRPEPEPTDAARPVAGLPSPIPLVRRPVPTPGVRPLTSVTEATGEAPPRRRRYRAAPGPTPDSPDAVAAAPDPLSGPPREPLLAPRLDPTIDEDDPLGLGDLFVPPADDDTSIRGRGWTSGSWAAPPTGLFDRPSPARSRHPVSTEPPTAERPSPGPPNGKSRPRREPVTRHRPVPESAPDRPAPGPTTEPAIDAAGLGLRPESLARLSATDRALLARLQAELGPRDRGPRGGGGGGGGNPDDAPTNGTNGTTPGRRVDPPDIAG